MAFCQGLSEGSSLGNNPRGFHRCDHLEPELLIAIKDQVFARRFNWKCLAQLLDDRIVRRMLRDVDVQDASTIVADDEEAVQHADVIVGTVKKSMAAIASRCLRRKASQRLAWSGPLGARFTASCRSRSRTGTLPYGHRCTRPLS
jgi:hypothetical protein